MNAAAARLHQPSDGAQQRALAGAIGADHGDDLAAFHRQRDAEQRLEVAVEDVDGIDLEQRRVTHRHRSPYRFPQPPRCGSLYADRQRR